MLRAEELPPGPYHPAGDEKALRELIGLLGDRPERDMRLVLDLARRVLSGLPAKESGRPGKGIPHAAVRSRLTVVPRPASLSTSRHPP